MSMKGSFSDCSFLWVTNAGAAEITANSIASLQRHLRKGEHSLYVGTLDQESEDEISGHIDCADVRFFRLDEEKTWRASKTDLPSGYADWGTQDFRLICKAKYYAISKILRATGKPVVFADGDIAFLKNPAEYFDRNDAIDNSKILAQNDKDLKDCNDDFDAQYPPGKIPRGSQVCAGFTGWQPNRTHLKIAEYIGRRVTSETCDQTIFNKLPFWKRRHVQLLPLDLFPNGSLAFGAPEFGRPELDLKDMYIVHANWRLGLESKIKVLKEDGYWFI